MNDFTFLLWFKLVILSAVWAVVGFFWTTHVGIGPYDYIFGVPTFLIVVGPIVLILGVPGAVLLFYFLFFIWE